MSAIDELQSRVRQAQAEEEQKAIFDSRKYPSFFEKCSELREALKAVRVVVPVRPADGMTLQLAQVLSIWYGEGTPWQTLNDHMGGFIEITRCNIVLNFLKEHKDAKYLLMIDNDMEPEIDSLIKLVETAEKHDLPIVSACAMSVSNTHGPQLCFTVKDGHGKYRFPSFNAGKIPSEGVIKAGHVGTGFILIRKDVLEAFTYENEDVPFYIPEEYRRKGAATGVLLVGEDIAFCNQARAKGFDCYIDLSVHVGHRKQVVLRWPDKLMDPKLKAESWVLPPDIGQEILTR